MQILTLSLTGKDFLFNVCGVRYGKVLKKGNELKLLTSYKNGNAKIKIYDDGSRVCSTRETEINLKYPLSLDVKISERCPIGCVMCHENSSLEGSNAPIENLRFLRTCQPGTEIAFGGGCVTEHPDLERILRMAKDRGLISNVTLHYQELIKHSDMIIDLQKRGLIYGVGVSIPKLVFSISNKECDKLKACLKELDNVVFHLINGYCKLDSYNAKGDLERLSDLMVSVGKPAKVLILGYKMKGRGKLIPDLPVYNNLMKSIKSTETFVKNTLLNTLVVGKSYPGLEVISFDNLALEQLNLQEYLGESFWKKFYQGDDGSISFYIDAVKGKYAVSSTTDTQYNMGKLNVAKMFKNIKSNYKHPNFLYRKGSFETNSSSCHCIGVVKGKERTPVNNATDFFKLLGFRVNGPIPYKVLGLKNVETDFGWGPDVLSSFKEKVAYYLACTEIFDDIENGVELVKEIIQEYVPSFERISLPEGDEFSIYNVNHNSQYMLREYLNDGLYDRESVKNFLLDDTIEVLIEYDGSDFSKYKDDYESLWCEYGYLGEEDGLSD